MDKLVRQTHSVSLSMDDRQIIEARKSKKIIQSTDAEIRSALGYILTLLGESAVRILDFADHKNPQCSVIIKSLRRAFPNLRIEELKTAFDIASDGKFEINLTLYNRTFNSEYISKVVNGYREFRKTSLVKEQKMLEAPKPEPTEEDKQKYVDAGIKTAYINYKENGILPKPCAWIYQEIEKKNGFVHSVEEKKQFFSKAYQISFDRLELLKSTQSGLGIKDLVKRQNNLNGSDEIKSVAREIALKAYWDEMIISEKL